MNCFNCGKDIKEEFNFCPFCGTPLKENTKETLKAKSWHSRLKGKIKDAIKYCEQIQDKDAYGHKNIGEMYFLIGDMEKAIEHFKTAIASFNLPAL